MDSPCGIGVKYTMRVSEDVPATQFFAAEKAAILGLPPGLPPTKNLAGEYIYSGMHDTGPLVPPAEGGIVAKLIGAVHDAKKYNDAYLSNVIQTEKDRAADTPSDTPKKKRTKQNDDSSFGIRLS